MYIPVSYTHLDVYKRQLLYRSNVKECKLSLFLKTTEKKRKFDVSHYMLRTGNIQLKPTRYVFNLNDEIYYIYK